MLGRRLLCLVLTTAFMSPVYADDPPFSEIIVFGDSLSDSGNLFQLTGGQLLPPPYVGGRASNGPVWVEHLADTWEIPLKNQAYVGAQTGFGLQEAPPSILQQGLTQGDLRIPSVGTQITNYLRSSRPSDDSLVVVWAGANDIFFGEANNFVSVNNLGLHIRTLARNGATTFLVPNMPPLDKTPYGVFSDPETQLALQYVTYDFNVRLEEKLQSIEQDLDVTIIRFDVAGLLNDVVAHPTSYGLADVTTPSIVFGGFPPQNPADFLFWDDVHPTTSGHAVLAAFAQAIVEANLVAP